MHDRALKQMYKKRSWKCRKECGRTPLMVYFLEQILIIANENAIYYQIFLYDSSTKTPSIRRLNLNTIVPLLCVRHAFH